MQVVFFFFFLHWPLANLYAWQSFRLQTFSFSCDFPSEKMFIFSPSSFSFPPYYIFIESLSGFGKAEKEIMMAPLRTVLRAKLLYLFLPFASTLPFWLVCQMFLSSQTSQFVNIWEHFHLMLCHSRNRCGQTLQMKTQHYTMKCEHLALKLPCL